MLQDSAHEVSHGPEEIPKVDPADPSWISPKDFVEFILNHESLTEEFCYMNRSGPYEFEIVPFSKINPNDYMTISIRGVTHYSNGELDYQDLSDWQRDQDMYRKIIDIPFFQEIPALETLLSLEECYEKPESTKVLQDPQRTSVCSRSYTLRFTLAMSHFVRQN